MQLLKSAISGTIAFLLIVALDFLYHMESLLQEVYRMDIMAFIRHYIWIYVAFIGIYLVITYAVYAYRYYVARRNRKEYEARLRQLEHTYSE